MKHLLLLLLALVSWSAQAQLTDDFSDLDFTNNPTWTGDVTEFQVNTAEQLQSNGPSTGSALHLRTANTLFQNAEWSFYAKIDFAGTDLNQARIYLMSDQADLEGPLNGYFIRMGENGSLDAIDLVKQQGTTISTVISGINGRISKAANNQAFIRVTRDAVGNWTLLSDTTGTGTTMVLEGTANDNSITSTAWFGVVAKYTSSAVTNRTKFFFDNFSISTAPLTILTATAVSNTQVDVLFSSNVAAASAQVAANYSVSGSGTPASAQRDLTNLSLVHLTLSTPLTAGSHTLTVNNVADVNGVIIAPNSTATFTFTPTAPGAQPKDIVINEIYADFNPVVGLPAAEFVELHNTTNAAISLAGFTFSDTTTTVTFPAGATIAANGYLILVANSQIPNFQSFGDVQGFSSLPSLNDAGDRLTLKRTDGVIIDRVFYRSTWYNDPVKSQGGWTLELINPQLNCSGISNWTASNNPLGGTPGQQNSVFSAAPDVTSPTLLNATLLSPTQISLTFSEGLDSVSAATGANYSLTPSVAVSSAQALGSDYTTVLLNLAAPLQTGTLYTLALSNLQDCSGNPLAAGTTAQLAVGVAPVADQVLINELLPDVSPAVGLPAAEFIELYNPTSVLIDLTGLKLTDGTSTATLPAAFLAPNSYVIITSSTNVAQFTSFGQVLGVSSFPSLNDDGDSLVLKTAGELIIDQVQYTNAWYQDPDKDDGGYSLERKNPNLPCSGFTNWSASTDPTGGTPGRQNSNFSNAPDTAPPALVSVEAISSTQVQLTFSEGLDASQISSIGLTLSAGLTQVSLQPVPNDRTRLLLTLSPAMATGTVYSLTVTNVRDCSGNVLASATASFGVGTAPGYQELLITELMADPSPPVDLPDAEYIELYNPTAKLLSLSGVRFSDPSTTARLPDVSILPGQYLIVCSTTSAELFRNYGRVIGVSSFPSLNSSGDVLSLRGADGRLVFTIAYTDDWYKDAAKADGGWSLEMIDTGNPCGGIENWTASENILGGTPGQVNSVQSSNPDQTAPQLLRADVTGPTTVLLRFNEQLDSLSAASAANYSISNGIAVTSASVQGVPFDQVALTLSQPLQARQLYTLTIRNLRDCAGNLLTTEITTELLVPEPADSGDVVLNEILFNPPTGGVDFVELYNRSGKTVDLKDWQLANVSNGAIANLKVISTQPVVMRAGDYLVLTTNGSILKQQYPQARQETFVEMSTLPTYPNESGSAVLLNPAGKVMDRFDYSEDLHNPLLDNPDGVSLERIRPDAPSAGSNWHSAASSAGYATPGYRNSQFQESPAVSGTVSIEPKVFTPDEDGVKDFATVNFKLPTGGYLTSITVFDSRGRKIKDLVKSQLLGTEGFYQWDGTTNENKKAEVGYYVFYIQLYDARGNTEEFKETVVLGSNF